MSNSLLAQAVLLLIEGKPVPNTTIEAIRILCADNISEPTVASKDTPAQTDTIQDSTVEEPAPAAATKAEPEVKPKTIAKIKKIVTKPAAAPVVAPTAPTAPAAPAAPTAVSGDLWRTHPSRLQSIDTNYCIARRITEKDHIPGTHPTDKDAKGKFFIEKQCSKKAPSGSTLCEKCAGVEAAVKLDPKAGKGKWYGRLDEESMYPLSFVAGSSHFLLKYPNGIPGDSFRPSATPALVAPTAPAAPVPAAPAAPAVAKAPRAKKAAASAPTTTVATTAATTAATASPTETVAVDTATKDINWKTFLYEGRLHIRNLKTGKTYFADSQKHNLEDMAIKEHYVGRWVNGEIELDDDDSDEE